MVKECALKKNYKAYFDSCFHDNCTVKQCLNTIKIKEKVKNVFSSYLRLDKHTA